jgi:DMSO/TMAO reductase YedYZ molybdopterin-dependent catalytic subunit
VLPAGPTPDVSAGSWRFRVDGMVTQPREWTWAEFSQLPFEAVRCDIHCVTKWSKLGTSFRGVSVDALLAAAEPLGASVLDSEVGRVTAVRPGVRMRLQWLRRGRRRTAAALGLCATPDPH